MIVADLLLALITTLFLLVFLPLLLPLTLMFFVFAFPLALLLVGLFFISGVLSLAWFLMLGGWGVIAFGAALVILLTLPRKPLQEEQRGEPKDVTPLATRGKPARRKR